MIETQLINCLFFIRWTEKQDYVYTKQILLVEVNESLEYDQSDI